MVAKDRRRVPPAATTRQTARAVKEARLAQALRANLKRRKEQARARAPQDVRDFATESAPSEPRKG